MNDEDPEASQALNEVASDDKAFISLPPSSLNIPDTTVVEKYLDEEG
jgi:hypothetical protein